MNDDIVFCPDCNKKLVLLSEWGCFCFVCDCGFKSVSFSRYEFSPDEITQDQIKKEEEGCEIK